MIETPKLHLPRQHIEPQGPTCRDALSAPAWIQPWLDASHVAVREICLSATGVDVRIETGEVATLITACVADARAKDGAAFRQATIHAYEALRDGVVGSLHRNLVRIWNLIPGIHDPLEGECDRYKHFNAGRFSAMCEWFGGAEAIPANVPAASGVGHDGNDLIVRALAMSSPGAAIENPAQVPAYRYSRRYGPLPPCFARATLVTEPNRCLLVAGTAAITGEQSQHSNDLSLQLELTVENLRVLLRSAGSKSVDPLSDLRHVRVYVSRRENVDAVGARVRTAFASLDSSMIEFVRADLCRPELLVEIEGLAMAAPSA